MIFYCIVARGTNILVEHHDAEGNFINLTNSLLEKIPMINAKRSFTFEKYNYHYIVNDGVVFLCLAAYDLGLRIPFQFLEEIKERFKAFCEGQGPLERLSRDQYSTFKLVLQDRILFYSDPNRSESVSHLKSEADAVVDIVQKNMGEADPLNVSSQGFNSHKFAQLQRRLRNRNKSKFIGLGIATVVMAFLIAFVVCYHYNYLMFKNRK